MDPLGNIPFFLAALRHVEPARQGRVIARELLIAYTVMVGFLFAGQFVLGVLRLSEPALTIAGGVILVLIAVRMVFPTPERSLHERVEGEPVIVLLPTPSVAGPSVPARDVASMGPGPAAGAHW